MLWHGLGMIRFIHSEEKVSSCAWRGSHLQRAAILHEPQPYRCIADLPGRAPPSPKWASGTPDYRGLRPGREDQLPGEFRGVFDPSGRCRRRNFGFKFMTLF